MDAGLEIIPILNKIDLPGAEPERRAQEVSDLLGVDPDDILRVSAKAGIGIPELLEAVVAQVPPPVGDADGAAARADLRLVLRQVSRRHSRACAWWTATLRKGTQDHLRRVGVGVRSGRSRLQPAAPGADRRARAGRSGLRRRERALGERDARRRHDLRREQPRGRGAARLPGSALVRVRGHVSRPTRSSTRRCATRWRSSSSTTRRSTTSRRRPRRSASASAADSSACCTWRSCRSGSSASSTSTSSRRCRAWSTRSTRPTATMELVENPALMPNAAVIDYIEEPYVKARIMAPADYIGPIMTLGTERRGVYKNMTYLDQQRVEFDWEFPLGEIILDFFDRLKTISRGYASLDYEMLEYRAERPRAARHADQRRPDRRVQRDLPRGQGVRLGPQDRRQAEGAHSAPAVRGDHPGGDRHEGHRAHDGEGAAQGRAREVLRRRHQPQAQAPREAEGRQEAHEAGGLAWRFRRKRFWRSSRSTRPSGDARASSLVIQTSFLGDIGAHDAAARAAREARAGGRRRRRRPPRRCCANHPAIRERHRRTTSAAPIAGCAGFWRLARRLRASALRRRLPRAGLVAQRGPRARSPASRARRLHDVGRPPALHASACRTATTCTTPRACCMLARPNGREPTPAELRPSLSPGAARARRGGRAAALRTRSAPTSASSRWRRAACGPPSAGRTIAELARAAGGDGARRDHRRRGRRARWRAEIVAAAPARGRRHGPAVAAGVGRADRALRACS